MLAACLLYTACNMLGLVRFFRRRLLFVLITKTWYNLFSAFKTNLDLFFFTCSFLIHICILTVLGFEIINHIIPPFLSLNPSMLSFKFESSFCINFCYMYMYIPNCVTITHPSLYNAINVHAFMAGHYVLDTQ